MTPARPWRAALWFAGVLLAVVLLPGLAPQDPGDAAVIQLADAFTPPLWSPRGDPRFWLGTDDQGRDLLSLLLHGLRLSLAVAGASVALALLIGVPLGLLAGWRRGWIDGLVTRLGDVQLTFPAVLLALLIDGVLRLLLAAAPTAGESAAVLVLAIGVANWVSFARLVRGSTRVEMAKTYVAAARLLGTGPAAILVRHVLPNIAGPVIVLAAVTLGSAMMTEATLSFLGIGLPPTLPSLGALVNRGQDFLFSGESWIAVLPGIALALLILLANLAADRLRRAQGGDAAPTM